MVVFQVFWNTLCHFDIRFEKKKNQTIAIYRNNMQNVRYKKKRIANFHNF